MIETTPYRDAAQAYYAAGWAPLPIRGKWPPPKGYTGADGAWPTQEHVALWMMEDGEKNIGLRLPHHVIGIDVDCYDGKAGAETIAAREAEWGPLPDTWTSTSRADGSGIRLYAVPPGMWWPGVVGPGVEVIQYRHRYAMVTPSIHPDGREYRWLNPGGAWAVNPRIPPVDGLPDLPARWTEGLTRGRAEEDIARADLDDPAAAQWLLDHGAGEPCAGMMPAMQRALLEITSGGSRHDAAMRATARVAHLIADGHRGGLEIIARIKDSFGTATGGEVERVVGEWNRLLAGAVRIAAARPRNETDPCDGQLGGAFGNGTTGNLALAPDADQRPEPAAGPTAAPATVPDAPAADSGPQTGTDPAMAQAIALEVAAQRARREAKRILDAEEAERAFRVPPSLPTLADELAIPDEPVQYLVDRVLPVGANVLLTAQFKTGKTTLVNNLARCLADGDPFLGALGIGAVRGRIAVFNYEVDDRMMRRWFRKQGIEYKERISLLNLRGYRLPVLVKSVEDWIVRWLVEREIAVWFVDPFARAFTGSGKSENDNTEVGAFLDALDVIKERAGVGELVLPTHTGREEREEGAERARGATRLDDWADVRWFLTKDKEGARYFSATGRDVELEEAQLAYDDMTAHLSMNGEGSRKDAKVNSRIETVVEIVNGEPGISLRRLREAIGGGKDEATEAIERAVARGLVSQRSGPNRTKAHFPAVGGAFGGHHG